MEQSDFQEMYRQFYKRLFYTVYPITRDTYHTEDIVQETFFKAFKKRDTISDHGKMGAWLSSIAVRTAIDFLRKESRVRGILRDGSFIEQEKQDSLQNVEQEVEISWLKDNLKREISLFNEEYQKIFLLKINHGYNEEEIARQLNLKPATVKTRIYRMRKRLKQIYIQNLNGVTTPPSAVKNGLL